ncbi:MAG: PD-(D/E)XK nuclease family protein [Bacillota bacterium]
MAAKDIDQLYFSASSLKTYQTCQLKFKRRYIDGLFWPDDWVKDEEKKKTQELGQLFHTLAERYYLRGKIVDTKDVIDSQLVQWLERLIDFRPYKQQDQFLPEQRLQLNQGELKLLAKYDLLHLPPDNRAVIYDWKTYARNSKASFLKRSLQTIVYRYLLVAAGSDFSPTGNWEPQDITLIYWNPRYPDSSIEFPYSEEQFLKDQRKIKGLIKRIRETNYGVDEDVLATSDETNCLYCEYRPICHGEPALEIEPKEEDLDLTEDWDEIEAITF